MSATYERKRRLRQDQFGAFKVRKDKPVMSAKDKAIQAFLVQSIRDSVYNLFRESKA